MSHTPGPWRWDDGDFLISDSVVYDTPPIIVKHEAYGFASEADMALIAAAPEMLGVLKMVEAYLSSSPYATDSNEELRLVRAVIAKAEHGT